MINISSFLFPKRYILYPVTLGVGEPENGLTFLSPVYTIPSFLIQQFHRSLVSFPVKESIKYLCENIIR